MKRYLFLLAWVEGSDSASGDYTNVHSQEDLHSEFMKGNEFIFAVDIHAPNDEIACAFGYAEAFYDNYTAADSTSTCLEVNETDTFPSHVKTINVDCVVV